MAKSLLLLIYSRLPFPPVVNTTFTMYLSIRVPVPSISPFHICNYTISSLVEFQKKKQEILSSPRCDVDFNGNGTLQALLGLVSSKPIDVPRLTANMNTTSLAAGIKDSHSTSSHVDFMMFIIPIGLLFIAVFIAMLTSFCSKKLTVDETIGSSEYSGRSTWTGYAGTSGPRPGSHKQRAFKHRSSESTDSIPMHQCATPSTYRGPYPSSNTRAATKASSAPQQPEYAGYANNAPTTPVTAGSMGGRLQEQDDMPLPAYEKREGDTALCPEAPAPTYGSSEGRSGRR